MSINANITLKRLVYEISEWAEAHLMIEAFGYGKYLQEFAEDEARKYPVFVVNCPSFTEDEWYFNYSMEIICLEWVYDDRANKVEAASDTAKIITDFTNTIRYSDRWQAFCRVDADPQGRKVDEFGGDKADGWVGTVIMKIKKKSGICDILQLLPTYDFENQTPSVSCPDVTFTFNGDAITPTASGDSKSIIVQDDDSVPAQVGTILTDISSELRIQVPKAQTLTRAYRRPVPYQTTSYRDYDTGWRIENNIDTYTPSGSDIMMMRERARPWKLISTNVFLHTFVYTGTTGGYYDPDTGLYYDVNGSEVDRSTAFPDELVVNHENGLLYQLTTDNLTGGQVYHMDRLLILSQGGFTGFYLTSRSELEDLNNLNVVSPYNTDNTPFNFRSLNKWTGDAYLGIGAGATHAFYISTVGICTPTSIGNSYRGHGVKYINPNTDL